MADCSKFFDKFLERISFTEKEMEKLRASRNALRNKIGAYFDEEAHQDKRKPSFRGQGSFKMDTIVKRLNGGYDMDDGTYFPYSDRDATTPSEQEFHDWIAEAVETHTDEKPRDLPACVRVLYSDNHHVDLTVYRERGDRMSELGHTEDGWTESDPKAFYKWFNDRCSETDGQLRRVIRYAKAWLDYKSIHAVKGIALTILVADGGFKKDSRDDLAFLESMKRVRTKLEVKFECLRPTAPVGENLFKNISTDKREEFLDALDDLISAGEDAVKSPVECDACRSWATQFGSRFSCAGCSEAVQESIKVREPFVQSTGYSA
jgi:hypothetical protein